MSWPEHRLVVSSTATTLTARARRSIATERDMSLHRLAGYRVLRITHRRLESEPAEVLAVVRSLLDRV